MCIKFYHNATMLKIGPSTFLEDEDKDNTHLRVYAMKRLKKPITFYLLQTRK